MYFTFVYFLLLPLFLLRQNIFLFVTGNSMSNSKFLLYSERGKLDTFVTLTRREAQIKHVTLQILDIESILIRKFISLQCQQPLRDSFETFSYRRPRIHPGVSFSTSDNGNIKESVVPSFQALETRQKMRPYSSLKLNKLLRIQ